MPRLRLCWRPWRLEINLRMGFGSRTFVPVSWMWKKQSSVSHSATESGIISLGAGPRMDGLPAPGLWDRVRYHVQPTTMTNPTWHRGNSCEALQSEDPAWQKEGKKVDEVSEVAWRTHPTHILVKNESQLHIFEDKRSRDQSDYQRTKYNDETRVKNPRSIGCSTESIWSPRCKSNMLTPKTHSQTFNQRKIFTRRMESSSSFVQHYEFLDVLLLPFQWFLSGNRVRKQSAMSKKVKRRLQMKALRWRRRDHWAWWRATRGVRKTLHKVWGIWSIRGMWK